LAGAARNIPKIILIKATLLQLKQLVMYICNIIANLQTDDFYSCKRMYSAMVKQSLKFISLLMLGLFMAVNGYGQAPFITTDCRHHIHGVVYDESRKPVFGAAIYVKELAKGNTTDQLGDYTINDLCTGTYTLICSFVGYEPDTAIISVLAGKLVVEQNFRLREKDIELGTV
jgi:hypothetical protein